MYEVIYVWPDGSWMWSEDYSEPEDAWKGDDFYVRHVNASLTEEEIDALVLKELLISEERYVLGI